MPSIRAIDQQLDESVVKTLEGLVEKAKSGELVGFVALTNYRTTTGVSRAGTWQHRDALIAFELWKKRTLEAYEYQDD